MDEEILGSVLHGIKPKDYTPIQVRPTPEFGGIQLTEEQQAKKDNMESVKDGEILPLGGFTDTVGAQWESAKDLVKSTDVYKNLFGNSAPDDNRLEQSEKLGSALGIAPQLIASDPDMYKAAVTTYERQRNAAALNNQPFSAKTLNELYPELDTEDPVATTIALKDYTNILKNREAAAQGAAVYTMPESKLTDLSNVIGYLYETGAHFAGTAYEAGQALDAQSELMYKASIGEISDEEVEKAIPGLMNAQKAYNAEIGDSYVAKIVGETISQLSMQKNMIMRGAAEIIAPIAPLAQPILAATKTNLPQIATLGAASAASAVGATGAVAGAAVTGAAALAGLIALGTASVFVGTYRAEAGQAYWDWRTKKDKNGKSVYTREQAIGHAKRVGRINAAIETGAWELALKGITRVWGSDAAKAVIKNEAAMKKLIGAGRAAVGAKAIGYGAKQFAKVAAPEIAEEGLQSLSADIDTSLFGKEPIPMRKMMRNALDAMIEAVPSVVGMSIGGAALAGAGAHRAMKRITGLSEMKDAVIEFKRENERSMLQKLMDLRSESSLYKKAPETYRKTLQNQLDHTGSGTLYIDASAAAENEKTHDALNKLVEDGTITAKELDDAIKTGKPLEVETGKYMQTATPETHEALSDYTTMDKGEKTIHAIREERQRMKDMIDIVTMTREKREAAAAEKILNDNFSDDTDIGREDRDTAREILSGGLDHIEDTCKTILQEAKDAWGKLTGVKELQDYMERRKTQDANFSNEKGVDMFDVGEGKDRVHLRVSKNPDWYQDFYGAYGRAPNQRELYDIAQEKIIAENDKGDEESKTAIAEIEEAKKRVESIERVSETLKSLNKEDLIAQALLDPETYEEAYKPLLEEIKAAGNGAVTKAARDSALVLAKLAENFHKNYGVPLKLAMIAAGEVSPETAHHVANEEDLVKLKSENPTYYQTAADKDLVVYHNVSTGKLREAIKLGGLPMPSLAITKRDIPFGDFGEITLIGDKDMIDPRKSRSNEYQGSYDRNANVIELFDGANESTVIHEGAHMFLSMLENMSQMSEENVATYFNGDTAKARAALKGMQGDLSTIRSWTAFSEDHLSEYKGTILEKEFTKYAEDIRAGKAGAMERWMQERFARGFEKYLMDGSAPTKEMQGVFRRFKKWLTDIYKTTKNLGNVELTPEIKDIFDRMISTESEINAWAAQRKLEAIDRTIDVNQSELSNLKAWAESVKDKALEKAMSYYLHMVREEAIENFKASISSEEERTSFIESLGENEIYQIETIYNSDIFPTKKDRDEFLQMAGFTEKDLKEKLRAAGGTTEERWNKYIEEMVQHYREEALTPESIRGMAEEILRSPEGMAKKSRIEAMLLEKKVSAYIHLVNSMQMELKRSKDKKKTAREIRKRLGLVSEKETTEIDKQTDVIAKSEDKIAKLEKQKKLLKEELEKAKAEAAAAKGENKSRKESQTILEGNMRALEAELEKERAQRAKADSTTKDAELTVADLAVQLQTMVDGLKESRDAMRFDMREIKEDARNTLGGEKLSHATSWRWWENKAQIAEARAMKAAAGNDWEGAAYWKREQAQCLTMAKFARANEEEIRRTLHGGGGKVTTSLLNENGMERYGILGILNRISRTDKPVMMKDDARYFVQHMAYVLGLTKKDGTLPIDESGQERPFNWHWLAVEMNPMQAMDDDRYMAEDIIPGWMRSAFDGSSPMKLKDLTMDQFREMAKVMKAVYKLGRREYEGNTLGTSFDEAAQKIHDEILDNWTHRVATPGLKNQTATNLDRLGTKIHSLIKDITLPEILIERLGKSAAEYFYKPMDKAAAHLRELKSAARVTFRKNFAIYSRKEWTAIRSKKLYTVGLDERGKPVSYTKEQLLAMALNFGTKSNRERLIETLWLSDTLEINEDTILDMLDKNLTDKDWDFVESVWDHLNSYWGERNKVQNDLYGTPLGKVQGEDFTLKSGRVIHGAYYRIKYDPLSSTKTSNFSTTDIAKMDMQNISSFSLGMGSTKQRAGASGGQKLRLDLDVYVEAVNEAMQHIAMREATVDVYKLLNRKEVVTAIENTAGPETLSLLQGWGKDCWHSSIKDMSEWDSALGRARRRFNFATMGFRFSTALLNIGNITGMMERMGAANALKAVGDFYFHGNIIEQRRFIQTKSTMMRDRGATIDRDMYMQDRLPVGKNESEFRSKIEHGKYGVYTLNSKAYWLIQATDEMFSLPEWLFTYRRAMAAMEVDGKLTRKEIDMEAVRLADKAVRETFGSNETKDQTSFTRKSGIIAQMTTFFSYTNLVTNQFIRAGYTFYDKKDIKPLIAATWYWWILGALVETVLRESGDDSDDEEKWKKKFLHVIASGGPIGGVPLAREAVPWTVDFFTGKSFGSAAPDAPFFDTLKHMENFLKATKKGDLIEMGRGATKAITRTSIPVPDTITDAFWNFMRMACTDTEFTMWDWFRKSLWDKTLKEKKK